MPKKEIVDKEIFDNLLKENKDAALDMMRDHGKYYEEVLIGEQQYKIFEDVPADLFTKTDSDLLPDYYAAIILSDIDYEKKEINRSDFKNWYFIGNADFNRAKFTSIANFGGAEFIGIADFRGAKFAQHADFEGAKFKNFKDSIRC
jgi:hypothetical protein